MRVGVYIDGFNVYFGGRSLCGPGTAGWRWLDLRSLAADLLGRRNNWAGASVDRVVYCTALIDPARLPCVDLVKEDRGPVCLGVAPLGDRHCLLPRDPPPFGLSSLLVLPILVLRDPNDEFTQDIGELVLQSPGPAVFPRRRAAHRRPHLGNSMVRRPNPSLASLIRR